MQVRVLACEPEDNRVAEAIVLSSSDVGITFVEAHGIHHHRSRSADPYEVGLRTLREGAVNSIVAGAAIALSEFLPLVFSTFNTSRKERLLYSAAPIEPMSGSPFLLVDPCVILSPDPMELAFMAHRAAELYVALYAKADPFVAVLSHATGSYHHHRDRRAASVVEELKRDGRVEVSEAIMQLDAALSVEAARRKAAPTSKLPNVLLCTDVGVANAVYKTLEMFGRSSVDLSGAIMMGLDQGLIGLLPRTCKSEEIRRLFSNLGRAIQALQPK
jgi:phosphotransacetylase